MPLPRHHPSIAPQCRAGAGGGLDLLHVAQQLRNGRTSCRRRAVNSGPNMAEKMLGDSRNRLVRHGENHDRGEFQGNVLKHGEFMVTHGGIQEN